MKYRAIYVEDEPSLRKMIPQLLARERVHVTGYDDFNSAYDAIKVINGDQLDLFITDITLPGGRGYHLIPELRRRRPNVPAIVFSGEEGDLREAHESLVGLDNVLFVKKPGIVELLQAVKHFIPKFA